MQMKNEKAQQQQEKGERRNKQICNGLPETEIAERAALQVSSSYIAVFMVFKVWEH